MVLGDMRRNRASSATWDLQEKHKEGNHAWSVAKWDPELSQDPNHSQALWSNSALVRTCGHEKM